MNFLSFNKNNTYLWIQIFKRIFFGLLTFGWYDCWYRTNVRKKLWNSSKFLGKEMQFTGSGGHIFANTIMICIGINITFFLFKALPFVRDYLIYKGTSHPDHLQNLFLFPLMGIVTLYFFLQFFCFSNAAPYILSNTRIGCLRFKIQATSAEYIWEFIKGIIVTIFSAGLADPYRQLNSYRFTAEKTTFGGAPIKYTGRWYDMMLDYLICYALTPFTLGLSLVFYRSLLLKHKIEKTSIGSMTFTTHYTCFQYMTHTVFNFLILLFSIGYGGSFVVSRNIDFMAKYIECHNALDLDSLEPSEDPDEEASTFKHDGFMIGYGL